MTLPDPFNGIIFSQMEAQAIATIYNDVAKAYGQNPPSGLRADITAVMENLLNAVGFQGFNPYVFNGDNAALVSKVSSDSGVDYGETETIIGWIYTEEANGVGGVPPWFSNPGAIVVASQTALNKFDALQPTFVQKVVGTIAQPIQQAGSALLDKLGISSTTLYVIVAVILIIAILFTVGYAKRAFN